MATPPAHMSTTSAATKQVRSILSPPSLTISCALSTQKLLQNIQMKEQQKMFEAHLATMTQQQISSMASPEILNALKVIHDGVTKETKQGTTATVFTAPTGVPDHIANSAGRK